MILGIDSAVSPHTHRYDAEFSNCHCYVVSDDAEEAVEYVKAFLEKVRGNRKAFMRAAPQVSRSVDFMLDMVTFTAVVRFSRCNKEAGEIVLREQDGEQIRYMSAAAL